MYQFDQDDPPQIAYLFRGVIQDIFPSGGLGERTVTIVAYDRLKTVEECQVSIALKTDTNDDIALAVLDAIGEDVNYDTAGLTSSTTYFWPFDSKAGPLLRSIVDSELGALWADPSGYLKLYGRNNLHYSGQAVATEWALDEDSVVDMEVGQAWESLYNRVTVNAYPYSLGSLGEVWRLLEVLEIAPGASYTTWAYFEDGDGNPAPASDVASPVATTDYTANSQAGGGGADMTSNLTVTATVYAEKAKLVLSNTHATTPLFVTLLKVRGKPISVEKVAVVAEDATSQAAYGVRDVVVDTPWIQSVSKATDYANALLSFWKDPQAAIKLKVRHLLGTDPNMLGGSILLEGVHEWYSRDLFNLVTLTAPSYGIDGVYYIGGLTWWTGVSAEDLWLEMTLEPKDNRSFWELGVDGATELGTTTVLGF